MPFSWLTKLLGSPSAASTINDAPSAAPPSAPPTRGTHQVWLDAPGDRKIQLIKAIREAQPMSLREAKDRAESAPCEIARLDAMSAERLAAALRAAGGEVRVVGPGGAPESEPGSARFVMLSDAGSEKIAVIRILRESLSSSLREAKDTVDSAPVELGPFSEERALELMMALVDAGATAEVR